VTKIADIHAWRAFHFFSRFYSCKTQSSGTRVSPLLIDTFIYDIKIICSVSIPAKNLVVVINIVRAAEVALEHFLGKMAESQQALGAGQIEKRIVMSNLSVCSSDCNIARQNLPDIQTISS